MTTLMTTMRPDELLARIREALVQLSLREMAAQLEAELRSDSQKDEDWLHRLWRLLEPQLIARSQRACDNRLRESRLPASRTLDKFDFDFQPELDRDRVMQLATLDFVRRGENLLVAGMSGTGKSHICIALGHLACSAGIRTRYTTSAEMLSTLASSLATNTLKETLKSYALPAMLIIDEVGLDRPERETTPDAQLFYKVVRPRHEKSLSTVITSNIAWDNWGDYLGDDVATVAILDRLIQHGHLLTIKGPSYRAYQHELLNASSKQPGQSEGSSPKVSTNTTTSKKPTTPPKPPTPKRPTRPGKR